MHHHHLNIIIIISSWVSAVQTMMMLENGGQSLIILITFVYLPSIQKQTSIKSSCCPSCLADSNGFCRQAGFAWLMPVPLAVRAACLYIKTTRTADKNGNERFPFLIRFPCSFVPDSANRIEFAKSVRIQDNCNNFPVQSVKKV